MPPKPTVSAPSSNAKAKRSFALDLPKPGASPSSQTCASSMGSNGAGLGYSPQELLASPQVEPGSNEARQMTAGSGMKLCAFTPKHSPLGRCMRILLESTTWGSVESLLKWKGSATKSGYAVFQLVPLIRHKTGTDFGLWPTAQSRDEKGVTQREHLGDMSAPPNSLKAALWPTAMGQAGQGDPNDPKRGEKLQTGLKAALWATAVVPNGGRTLSPEDVANKGSTDKGKRQVDLRNQLKCARWPTATQRDESREYYSDGKGYCLPSLLRGLISSGCPCPPGTAPLKFAALQLSFTSWLMGYSEEYLQNFVPSSSPPSATPSSGPSPPKSSAP